MMEFLTRNWVKLLLITLSVVGLVLAIINIADVMRLDGTNFMDKAKYFAWMFFFLGMIIVLIAKLFNWRYFASLMMLITGILVTIFFILTLVRAGDVGAGRLVIFPLVNQLLVLGILPLIWGTNKVCMYWCDTEKGSGRKKIGKSN